MCCRWQSGCVAAKRKHSLRPGKSDMDIRFPPLRDARLSASSDGRDDARLRFILTLVCGNEHSVRWSSNRFAEHRIEFSFDAARAKLAPSDDALPEKRSQVPGSCGGLIERCYVLARLTSRGTVESSHLVGIGANSTSYRPLILRYLW